MIFIIISYLFILIFIFNMMDILCNRKKLFDWSVWSLIWKEFVLFLYKYLEN